MYRTPRSLDEIEVITGETSVGKELVAQTIHFGGPWAAKSLAHLLPQISQAQFMSTGCAKKGQVV